MATIRAEPVADRDRRTGTAGPPAPRHVQRAVGRLLLAAVAAAGVTALYVRRLPQRLEAHTDSVGYPLWAGFNINRYVDIYHAAVLLFPALTLLLFAGAGRVLRTRGVSGGERPARTVEALAPLIPAETAGRTWPGLRVAAVGLVLGVEAAVVLDATGGWFWVVLAAGVLLHAALVSGLAAAGARLSSLGSGEARRAAANAALVPLCIAGLGGVSAVSAVHVESDGTWHSFPWLPLWVALVATLVAGTGTVVQLRRATTLDGVRSVERRVLVWVLGSVATFLLVAQLPAKLDGFSTFEEGHGLAGARLLDLGWFPWRDWMNIHGLLDDGLAPWVGLHVFQDSRWGYQAGYSAIVNPLAYITLYLLAARLFRQNTPFVVLSVVLFAGFPFVPAYPRYLLWPIALLLLMGVLEAPRWARAVSLGAVLVVSIVISPETAYTLPATAVVLVVHDLATRRPGTALPAALTATLRVGCGAAAASLVIALWLLANHALGSFVWYFVVFAPDHALASGLPLDPLNTLSAFHVFAIVAPLVGMLAAMLHVGVSVWRRRALPVEDWAMCAAGLVSLAYYEKFVDRADAHVYEAYAVAAPFLLFVAYRTVTYVEEPLRRLAARRWHAIGVFSVRPVSLALLAVAIGLLPGTPTAHLCGTVATMRPVVAAEPALASVGFEGSNTLDAASLADVRTLMAAYLRPGERLLDLSNSTAVFYYLLDYLPADRYYHVSMAIREPVQRDLIDELQSRGLPRLVVYASRTFGLTSWDGITVSVRHYDIAEFVLHHYRPFFTTPGAIVYERDDLDLPDPSTLHLSLNHPVITRDVAYTTPSCDWGMVPEYLSAGPRPIPPASVPPLTLTPHAAGTRTTMVLGWAVDPLTSRPATTVVAAIGDRIVGSAAPYIARGDVAAYLHNDDALLSGFILGAHLGQADVGAPLDLYAVRADGTAVLLPSSITAPPAVPPTVLHGPGGQQVPVSATPGTGYVDRAELLAPEYTLTLPAGAHWADYRWVQIDPPGHFVRDTLTISDDGSQGIGHDIVVRTDAQTPPAGERVLVDSCPQWHAYTDSPLLLSTTGGVADVRLLP